MYVRYPLSLRQVEDLLLERNIDIVGSNPDTGHSASHVRFLGEDVRFSPSFGRSVTRLKSTLLTHCGNLVSNQHQVILGLFVRCTPRLVGTLLLE